MIGQLRSLLTNRRRVSDNNNISQLLRDSFYVSQQPPIWEPPSHYSMCTVLYCSVLQVHLRAPALEEGGAGLPGHAPGQAHQQAGGGEQQVTARVLCPCDVAPSVAMAGVVPVMGVGG